MKSGQVVVKLDKVSCTAQNGCLVLLLLNFTVPARNGQQRDELVEECIGSPASVLLCGPPPAGWPYRVD